MFSIGSHDKRIRRMSENERQVRRKYRRLIKLVASVEEHKKPLARAFVELASKAEGSEERLALNNLVNLVCKDADSAKTQEETNLLGVLRSIESGDSGVLGFQPSTPNTPSTPTGHRNHTGKATHINIYTPTHHTGKTERLSKPKDLWSNVRDFAADTYSAIREYRDASIDFRFPWSDLSAKEKRVFVKALKDVYGKVDAIEWPVEEIHPPVPAGHVDCPACGGSGHVLRSLKIALEWFLARRAKVQKGGKRYKIEPGDWGYEEIAAVELCDHYRNSNQPMVEMVLETQMRALQDSQPTQLDPHSLQVNRYPTEKQIQRGMLEIRAAQKKLSGMHSQQLKGLKKQMVPGPTVIKHKDKTPTLDWTGKGIGCRVIHTKSGLEYSCESFSNFRQNFAKAEKELEKQVAKWFAAQLEKENMESLQSVAAKREAIHQALQHQ